MIDVNVVPDMIADLSAFEDDAAFRSGCAVGHPPRVRWHAWPNAALSGVINSRGGTVIRLPARHVTSIESLTDRQGNPLAYAYDPETGLVESLSGGFPAGVAAIRYAIHAGYDDAPDAAQVLISAAKRAGTSPIGLVTSQSTNGSSASFDVVSLMQAEKEQAQTLQAWRIAMSLLDDMNAGGGGWRMPGATKWRRLRARKVDDPYSGEQAGEDWSNPGLRISPALSPAPARTPDGLREQTTSTAYLTSPDPSLDIMPGDRIRALPDDGRCWEVSGYPSRDANAFVLMAADD